MEMVRSVVEDEYVSLAGSLLHIGKLGAYYILASWKLTPLAQFLGVGWDNAFGGELHFRLLLGNFN